MILPASLQWIYLKVVNFVLLLYLLVVNYWSWHFLVDTLFAWCSDLFLDFQQLIRGCPCFLRLRADLAEQWSHSIKLYQKSFEIQNFNSWMISHVLAFGKWVFWENLKDIHLCTTYSRLSFNHLYLRDGRCNMWTC